MEVSFTLTGGKTILEIKGCQRRVIAYRFRCRSCGGQSVRGEVGSLGVVPSMSQELHTQGVKISETSTLRLEGLWLSFGTVSPSDRKSVV